MQFWKRSAILEEVKDGTSNLRGLDADGCQSGGEDLFGLRTDTKVRVGLGINNAAVAGQDVGGRQDQSPSLIAVHKRDVDQDGAVVVTVILRDGVGEAKLLGKGAAGIGKHREGQAVLANHEVALAGGLWADGGKQRACLAEARV